MVSLAHIAFHTAALVLLALPSTLLCLKWPYLNIVVTETGKIIPRDCLLPTFQYFSSVKRKPRNPEAVASGVGAGPFAIFDIMLA